MKLRVEERT
jgi:hypothetical protein